MPKYIDKNFTANFLIILALSFNILLFLQNMPNIKEVLSLGFGAREVFYIMYDFENSFSNLSFALFLINNILLAFSITSIIKLYKIEKNIFAKSSKLGVASVFAVIGSHCASCGSVILASIFGSTLAYALPLGGVEFTILSIIILLYTNYKIHLKLINPYVC